MVTVMDRKYRIPTDCKYNVLINLRIVYRIRYFADGTWRTKLCTDGSPDEFLTRYEAKRAACGLKRWRLVTATIFTWGK